MGKASRDKGQRGEREIVEILKRLTGALWMRVPLSGGFHLDLPGDVMKKRGQPDTVFDEVMVEVKNTASVSLPAWIRQCQDAEEDARSGFKPNKWLIFSKVKGEWFATMPIDQLERFIK